MSDDAMEGIPAEIAVVIAAEYPVSGDVTCEFLRHGFNDHFRARDAERPLHVRLYLDGKYYIAGEADLRFELAFVNHLAANGCAVAPAIARTDGGLLTSAEIGGARRHLAVFAFAPGDVEREPDDELVGALGTAIASIHAAADTVPFPIDRYQLDERYLLRQPVDQLTRVAGADDPDIAVIASVAERLGDVLASLPRTAPAYGVIHADLHPGNVHVDGRDFTFFDFDHCAVGWRAYDLAPARMLLGDEQWQTLLAGYAAVRDLPPGIEHIDDFVLMRQLWDVGDMLAMEAVWNTTRFSDRFRPQIHEFALSLSAPDAKEVST